MRRLYLYRWEGFAALRAVMCGVTVTFLVLAVLSVADLFGTAIF